ncbi:arylsulfatase J-like isoform X2 [Apostichopus japonicus]|uniref:arylsulfatase J-like isoform X2 n=1 Tax=Stichopus japonicus TaxID=307972 RepID=UPI003AB64EDF
MVTSVQLVHFSVVFFLSVVSGVVAFSQPHVVVIVADDLGWNDVSFHGSPQILTPNMDKLALDGVILFNYYVLPICTPTRSALLTGRYAIHTGMQTLTIGASRPYGVPLNFTMLPEKLRQLGYTTHAVGKWHLGFYNKAYIPTQRGFDSYYGYYCGKGDYFNHINYEQNFTGFDFHQDGNVYKPVFGQYSTEIFTAKAGEIIKGHDPSKPLFLYLAHQAVHSANKDDLLQAPQEYIDRFPHISFEKRRKFAGMVAALDDSVGNVTAYLKEAGLYDNTIIIFTTDNGGPAHGFDGNYANNFPLRGVKHTLWEGGVRGTSFVHSPLINKKGRISDKLLHVTDFYPTILKLAGGNISEDTYDGFDIWDTISNDSPSPRREILLNIDPVGSYGALRSGDYKVITGNVYDGQWSGWYPPEGENNEHEKLPKASVVYCPPIPANASTNCDPAKKPCLYHIPNDPCEFYNLADMYPDILSELMDRLRFYNSTMIPSARKPRDPNSNPMLHGGNWIPWT